MNLSNIPLTPKSGEHEDQIAPMLVVANIAITASGILGIKAATLSPFFKPIFLKLCAIFTTSLKRLGEGQNYQENAIFRDLQEKNPLPFVETGSSIDKIGSAVPDLLNFDDENIPDDNMAEIFYDSSFFIKYDFIRCKGVFNGVFYVRFLIASLNSNLLLSQRDN